MLIGENSRLLGTRLYYRKANGKLQWGLRIRTHLRTGDVMVVHTVKDGDRLDILSDKYYGTPDLDWLIADVNNLWRPWDLSGVTQLKIPTLETVGRLKSS